MSYSPCLFLHHATLSEFYETDKTYRALKDANEAQEEGGAKYHIVGGAAGSVSPCKISHFLL